MSTELDINPVTKQPLPDGTDIWAPVFYNPATAKRIAYFKVLEAKGVEATCESCGKTWKVHPSQAGRVTACSKRCSNRARTARERGELPPRPLVRELTWKPWTHCATYKKES